MSTSLPGWLERWRLQALNNPQITLFEPEQALAHHERLLGLYEQGGPAGVLLTEQPLSMCQTLLEVLVPLGLGPAYDARIDGVQTRPWLWVRKDQPQQILVALHEFMPPILWFSVGQEVAQMYATLGERVEDDSPSVYEFTKQARGFMGTQAMVGADLDELRTHFSQSPFVTPLFWGSAHDDDPWPASIDLSDHEAWEDSASELMAQGQGKVRALSMRTLVSRSVIRVEVHLEEVFVVHVFYEPQQNQAQIQALNVQFGAHYPEDMPLDVVAALLGFYFEDDISLRSLILSALDPEETAFYVMLLACVGHGELSVVETLRPFLKDAQKVIRAASAEVSIQKHLRALAWGRLPREQAEDVLERLTQTALEPGAFSDELAPVVAHPVGTQDVGILPGSLASVFALLRAHEWALIWDQRFYGPCARRTRWERDGQTLKLDVWPACMGARLSGAHIPEWVQTIEPHPLELEDARAVAQADVDADERAEALAQTGLFFVERPVDEAYAAWLSAFLDEDTPLAATALDIMKLLQWPTGVERLQRATTSDDEIVRTLATRALADALLASQG